MIKKFKLTKGFSQLVTSGIAEGITFIIMEKNGPNLKSMLRKCKTKRFSIKTALQIGIQMVDRLKTLHEIGYLHLDIKPDNILMGAKDRSHEDASTLVLIDFGLSKRFENSRGEHVQEV